MVKIRVYELAKDLNMTNRALLNKMKELKIEVKSHMSSLEDSAIREIKTSLFGKKQQKNDVKVKSSVIRRRGPHEEEIIISGPEKALDQEAPSPMETPEAAPAKERPEPGEKQDKKAVEPGQAEAKKKAPKVKLRKSEPAKIVKPVPAAPPSQKAEEPVAQEPGETKKAEQAPKKEASKPKVPAATAAESKQAVKEALEPEQAPVETKPLIAPEISEESETEDALSANKKKKKKRKATPAKIVKSSDPAVLENIKKLKAAEEKSQASPRAEEPQESFGRRIPPIRKEASSSEPGLSGRAVPDLGLSEKAAGEAGFRKKDKRREVPESEFAGKRKKRKQKSVVEGADLYAGRGRKKKGRKDARGPKGNFQKTQITTPKAIKRRIKIDEAIELAELAKRMGIKANEMIVKLMGMGVMATVNQTIDYDTAVLVATEFDFEVERANFEEDLLLNIQAVEEDDEGMVETWPVVTIMGHVDHGKTSLLDVIRKSKITSGEAGGITQHIGAYNVETPNGGRITFLDTPGHAAFTAMRSRGAKVTDIVILVVAADDGVMPQTIEAINHSKAAGVPVVVAVNKMDKPGANPDRIMRELSELDLLSEEWGGKVIFVKVSAKTGEGIDELLEMILLQSEVLELKANPDRKANGYVIESRLDVGRGAVATVLVKQGTLRDGDPIVCGLHSGRIRAMNNDSGERIDAAGPSMPVEIVGLTGVPDAGDEFIAVASDKDAKQIAGHRMQKQRAKELAKKSRANLEKMFESLGSAEVKELKLIVKADVHGSIEALNDSLKELAKEEVDVKIVHSGTGTINESDVSLAAVSDAIIIGFNVRPSSQIRKIAKDENVDMRFYDIIYNVINDIKAALDGMMPSTFHEIIIGRAEVQETFVVPKMGTIAGCRIVEGKVVRGKKIRLLRDGVIKCDTDLSSLRRFKDDVKEVDQGYECGIGLQKYNDIKIGDEIECYEIEERKYKGD